MLFLQTVAGKSNLITKNQNKQFYKTLQSLKKNFIVFCKILINFFLFSDSDFCSTFYALTGGNISGYHIF